MFRKPSSYKCALLWALPALLHLVAPPSAAAEPPALVHFPHDWQLWDAPLHLGGRVVGSAMAGDSLAARACLPGHRHTPMQCGYVPGKLWVGMDTREGPRWACVPHQWVDGHERLRSPEMNIPPPPPKAVPASQGLRWEAKAASALLRHPRPDAPVAETVRPGSVYAVVGEEEGYWVLDDFGSFAYVAKDDEGGKVGRSLWDWMLQLLSGGETYRTCLPFSLGPEVPLPMMCPANGEGRFMDEFDREYDIADRAVHWYPVLPDPGSSCPPSPVVPSS